MTKVGNKPVDGTVGPRVACSAPDDGPSRRRMCDLPVRLRHDGGVTDLAQCAARAARPSGRREHPARRSGIDSPDGAGPSAPLRPVEPELCAHPPGTPPGTRHHVGRVPTTKENHHDRPPTPHPATSAPSRRLPRPERRAALSLPLHPHLGALDHLGGREHLPRHRGGPVLRRAPRPRRARGRADRPHPGRRGRLSAPADDSARSGPPIDGPVPGHHPGPGPSAHPVTGKTGTPPPHGRILTSTPPR